MSQIQQGLLIAAIGMGLVFAVIIFLWGLMALLLRLTSKRESHQEVDPSPALETDLPVMSKIQDVENQRRAAAAAVGVQLAVIAGMPVSKRSQKKEISHGLSAWQTVNRTRQHQQKQT